MKQTSFSQVTPTKSQLCIIPGIKSSNKHMLHRLYISRKSTYDNNLTCKSHSVYIDRGLRVGRVEVPIYYRQQKHDQNICPYIWDNERVCAYVTILQCLECSQFVLRVLGEATARRHGSRRYVDFRSPPSPGTSI